MCNYLILNSLFACTFCVIKFLLLCSPFVEQEFGLNPKALQMTLWKSPHPIGEENVKKDKNSIFPTATGWFLCVPSHIISVLLFSDIEMASLL